MVGRALSFLQLRQLKVCSSQAMDYFLLGITWVSDVQTTLLAGRLPLLSHTLTHVLTRHLQTGLSSPIPPQGTLPHQ